MNRTVLAATWVGLVLLRFGVGAAAAPGADATWVRIDGDGKLLYAPDARGNVIPDYSYAGYGGGGVRLPDAPVKVTLRPEPDSKDDSPRIQAAIDGVGRLPADAAGIRGAVLLEKGIYSLAAPLVISVGGVILRGAGDGEDGAVLRAVMQKKARLISIRGKGDRREEPNTRHAVVDARVPAGGKTLTLDSTSGLKVGDPVMVVRNTNARWVQAIGMDRIPPRPGEAPPRTSQWKPGPRESYDRTIVAIDGAKVTLDVPVYNDITAQYGGGFVYRYSFPGRIARCGVEKLRAVSVWSKRPGEGPVDSRGVKTADDLKHADNFIVIDNAENCWVRDCSCIDFLQGGVWIEPGARFVTVQDCYYEVPDPSLNYYVDEPHGQTSRYSFSLHGGCNLVQRCSGKYGRHTFMTQSQTPGPNVFLDCDATGQHNLSETHHRWATGVLFDRVGTKSPTSLQCVNRAWMGSGHGWSGAYVTMWNCVGNPIICEIPPTASNWAVGCSGGREHGPFNERIVEEAYQSWGKPVQPESLYRAQLRERLGEQAVANIAPHATDGSP